MQFLIFTLLALAVSAENYGYGGSYSNYPSYSSYPSSYYGGYGSSIYGSGYGGGYGSYGSGYGSGISYALGGAGQSSYSSGDLGGYYTGYKPAVYQTARYFHNYPQRTAAYKIGSHEYSTAEGPARIAYTQDFPGIAGYSGQSGIPTITGFQEVKSVGSKTSSGLFGASGSIDQSGEYGIKSTEGPAHVSFIQDFSKSPEFGIKPEIVKIDHISPIIGGVNSRQPSGYIHRSGAEAQEFSGVGGPRISFTLGGAALQQPNSKVIPSAKVTAPAGSLAPKTSSQFFGASGSIQKNKDHGVRGSGGPAHISFVQDLPKSTGQSHEFGIKPETKTFEHISPVPGGISSTHSSTHGADSLKTQSHGISGAGGQGEIIFTQDITGHRVTGTKPVTSSRDKLRAGGASAFAKQTSTHGAGFLQKAENDEITGIGEQGEIIFAQDINGGSGHSGHRIAGVRPAEASRGASAFAKQSSGYVHNSGAVHKTGGHGFSTAGGPGPQISFVLGGATLHQPNPKIIPSARLTAPVSAFAPKQPSTHGAGTLHKTEAHGFSSGVTRQGEITFTQNIAAVSGLSGHHSAGAIPVVASFDKLNTRGVSAVPKQSSGYVSRTSTVEKTGNHGFSIGAGPQISFTLGGASLQQPGSKAVSFDKLAAPAAGVAPKPSYGQSGVSGALSKNIAQGFSTVSGPSRISFTQDFSQVSSHEGIKPFVSSFDKVNIPVFPGAAISHGHQLGQRHKATFATAADSKSVQSPFAGIPFSQTPKQQIVEQPIFTAINGVSPAHGSFIGSSFSHGAGEKPILVPGHTGYLVDYKPTIASVESSAGDKSSYGIVPETTFGHDRSTVFKHAAIAGERLSGAIHHSSEGIIGHRELGGTVSSYKISSPGHFGEKSSILVAVPAESYDDEKTSTFLPSSGVAPSGAFAIDKGSILKLSGGADYAVFPQGHGRAEYGTVTAPFKKYYSSLYPGYSQISGESPRYGFSHDRSLLYSSPYLASPFSYSYTSDKQSQMSKKSTA